MNNLYTAKETGKTEKGTWYSILQDAPNSFHISVSLGNTVLYDHLANPTNMEDIRNVVHQLEDELLNMIQTQSNT
jgi:hypothetical protein